MAATTPQALFDVSECFACFGLSQSSILKIAMLRNLLLEVDPTADVDPQSLLAYAKCFACVGMNLGDIFELALMNLLSGNISGGGGGGGGTNGELFCGHYGGGSPTDTPTGSCALANDLDSPFNQWVWNGSAWI